MKQVTLVPHQVEYAQRIWELVMNPHVRGALGLPEQTPEDTRSFIQSIIRDEEAGKQVSRVVLDERGELIGITTLMAIDHDKKECHIGSWLGYDYWGQGYNQSAKIAILRLAFEDLGLERVFAGARLVNERSQQAQAKLPYMTIGVNAEFPEVHAWLEAKEKQPCTLNVVYRADFLTYMAQPK